MKDLFNDIPRHFKVKSYFTAFKSQREAKHMKVPQLDPSQLQYLHSLFH